MTECIKVIGGSCNGCPILDHCGSLIEHGVPYQEVLEYTRKLHCKEGKLPSIQIEKDPKDLRISAIILEGERIEWKRKK